MGEIQPEHIGARAKQFLDHLRIGTGGAQGRDDLRPPMPSYCNAGHDDCPDRVVRVLGAKRRGEYVEGLNRRGLPYAPPFQAMITARTSLTLVSVGPVISSVEAFSNSA
jgi:hypothetical protein